MQRVYICNHVAIILIVEIQNYFWPLWSTPPNEVLPESLVIQASGRSLSTCESR